MASPATSPPSEAPISASPHAGKRSFRNRVTTVMRRASSFGQREGSRPSTPPRASSERAPSRQSSLAPAPLATPPPADDIHMSPTPIVENAQELPSVAVAPTLETVVQQDEPERKEDEKPEQNAPALGESLSVEPEQMRSRSPSPRAPSERAPYAAPPAALVPTEAGLVLQTQTEETHAHGETPFSPKDTPPEVVAMPAPEPAPFTMPAPEPAPVTMPAPHPADLEPANPWDTISVKYSQSPQAMSDAAPSITTKPSKSSLVGGTSGTQSRRVSISSEEPRGRALTRARGASVSESIRADQIKRIILVSESNGDAREDGPPVEVVTEDPFADPPSRRHSRSRSVSRHVDILSPVESVPEIEPESAVSSKGSKLGMPQPQVNDSSYDATPTPISMPLPPMQQVIPGQYVHTSASRYSLGTQDHHQPDTDETLPLLARSTVPSRTENTSSGKGQPVVPYYPTPAGSHWPVAAPPTPQAFGWTEYTLPDGSRYYVHAHMRVTTDMNLRNPKQLEAVTAYFDQKTAEELSLPPVGWEMWLREARAKGKHEFSFIRHWINHDARVLSFSPPPAQGGAEMLFTDDDKLDVEYRYWAFVEGHPAHHSLPENAHAEAMDALTWSYTDCLLPSSRHAVAPFEQGECQELMTLLRSLEDPAERSKTQSVVHTRIVSKILMRVAQWRQSNFRPHKPLPNDASKSSHVERRVPFRRTLFDFVVSVVCLGIPYIFMDRTSHRRLDEESNLRNAGPMLMIGACACLLAAILLSASVTFLSFPGLDDVARVSGFLTVLCSIASMAAWVISMFRYNTETERTVRFVGQEGMIVISKRSVVMSLPLVFLAYSIIAFVTGVTIYSFRGFSVTNSKIIVRHFDEYTKWTVLGTLGGFGGVLLTAALLTR